MNFKEQFIHDYGPLANDIAQATGLQPGTVLGQLAVESGWGRHYVGNNPFGISYGGHVNAFGSVPDSAQAYVDLMKARYQNAIQEPNVAGQALMITRDGYAGPDRAYGDKVVAAANEAQKLGFQAQTKADDLVSQGQAIFSQMSGIPAPSTQEKQPANASTVDISSDNLVDQGKELFKQMTGRDPDAPVPETSAQEGSEQAGAAGVSQPAAQQHGSLFDFGAGVLHSLDNAGDVVGPAIAQGMNFINDNPVAHYIENKLPFAAAPHEALSQFYTPQNIQARQDQYAQGGYGDTTSGQLGEIAGETVPLLAATAPIGLAGEGALAMAANPLLRAGIRLGTGALQGAVGSEMTGGSPTAGAVGGAAMGAVGGLAGPITKLAGKTLANKAIGQLAGIFGVHLGVDPGIAGELANVFIGKTVGEGLSKVADKYGPKVAGAVAKAIQSANASGLTTGTAGAIGGKVGNQLEPIPGQ